MPNARCNCGCDLQSGEEWRNALATLLLPWIAWGTTPSPPTGSEDWSKNESQNLAANGMEIRIDGHEGEAVRR
jgi:hypothetical protein